MSVTVWYKFQREYIWIYKCRLINSSVIWSVRCKQARHRDTKNSMTFIRVRGNSDEPMGQLGLRNSREFRSIEPPRPDKIYIFSKNHWSSLKYIHSTTDLYYLTHCYVHIHAQYKSVHLCIHRKDTRAIYYCRMHGRLIPQWISRRSIEHAFAIGMESFVCLFFFLLAYPRLQGFFNEECRG